MSPVASIPGSPFSLFVGSNQVVTKGVRVIHVLLCSERSSWIRKGVEA